MTATAARPRTPGAFSSPAFVRLWSGSVASNVGTQMNNVAKAWLLWQLTHSALALGIEGLCFSAPMTVLPLVSGALADRVDRLALVRVTLVFEAAQALALAVLAAQGALQPWMFYLAAAADATRLAVSLPAQSALVPNLVPAELLQPALAISSATWSSSALIGPAVGGALLAAGGAASVFIVNAVTTLVAVLALVGLGKLPPPAPEEHDTVGRQLTAGVTYLRQHRRVLHLQWVLLVSMAGVLGVETLLPIFAADSWHSGSLGYGLLRTAPGVAAVVAGLAMSRTHRPTLNGRVIPVSIVGAATALAGFAATPPLAAALVLLGTASLCFTVTQIVAGVEIQRAVPDRLRGRVNALGAVGQNGLAGISAVATSAVAGQTGAGWALAGLSAVVVAATLPPLLLSDARQGWRRLRFARSAARAR
jgi:predicted MFS family arabinose efflux permease